METEIKEYVLCLAFKADKVCLIKKAKPAWQAGLLNGIGGKVESNESYYEAIKREFKEETGIEADQSRFHKFLDMGNYDWACKCFYIDLKEEENPVTMEEEVVAMYDIKYIINSKGATITNIPWMILLALDSKENNLYTNVFYK